MRSATWCGDGRGPRPVAPAGDVLMADCLANWPGRFAESSRAELDRDDPFAKVPTHHACQHILAACSLRLQQAVDPADLARFQGPEKPELVGPAAVHAAHVHRLGALDEVHFTRPGVLDVALIRPPPTLTGVTVVEGSLRSAEQLWRLGGVQRVVLDRVRIEEARELPGRTSLQGLALSAVDGELDAFLHGAIGLRQLRLREQPLATLAQGRLHHLRRVMVEPAPASVDYCAAIARWHSIRGEAARACGHRFAIPD